MAASPRAWPECPQPSNAMAADPVTAVATAVADSVELIKQKDAQLNTPAMVKGKEAARDAAADDKTAIALAKKDIDEIRRENAN